ncbi:unnamed protein product [Cercopithifilaria johnstoni]|uniref:Thrombospondin type 1 domain protein n=1 Tax=Cercopithifilaria johnstoni TaxID=2874296 RepID=A0A8J2PWT8_9BILA|nr:unnamed protein product [Cercopithifilaria johnstoni]
MIFLHIPQIMMQKWCCVPYPCKSSAIVITPTTTAISTVVTTTQSAKVSVTKGTTAISTVRPYYSDWTAWSCTESCGGCGIGRRTRICLSATTACIDATVEFNHQSCNQQPCPFGKRTCCVNYRLGQIEGHFACIPYISYA